MNENENITHQNVQDAAHVVLRGKFIAVNTYIRSGGKSQINNITFYLKKPGKEEQT